jgi:DNA repair exonuclease SbcCD nuclease subunit
MAVFITGDTHGGQKAEDVKGIALWKSVRGADMSMDDYLIICGDCGVCWPGMGDRFENWLLGLGCTVLFVDGNHEDHLELSLLDDREMFGADVGVVCEGIYHLRRGRIYLIDGHSYFCFGGGVSVDKKHRLMTGRGWWPEEIPSEEEFMLGMRNLIDADFKVDVVVSHTAPSSVLSQMFRGNGGKKDDPTTFMLQRFFELVDFQHWYCGHFHREDDYGKVHVMYNEVVEAFPPCKIFADGNRS